MISAADVSFAYDGTPVLADVALDARSGGVVGLIGPNGSGKSTLLRILYAALAPRRGTVLIDDTPVASLPRREAARRISVVAQEASPELPVSVAEMVLLGRSPHRSALQAYTAEDHRIAATALTRVGMRDLADRSFATLSGGEKQRTLIARALAQEADHLLLDEPTNHLDVRYQHEVLHLVRTLGITTVVVLHDLNLAARYCDSLVLLDRGSVARSGPTPVVLTPEVVEPVYRVAVRLVDDGDCVQLVFRPQVDAASPQDAERLVGPG
ncbi:MULTISPECIES: ABC transporter ATP-binding protein [Actinoalloteichus]|uniref:ABC-type cobalamin/Fe3+-siderophore transport system, ATPase component n=1 Tax=Actinoalloteichus fjordicus TaxID=1612552 RepID=A0AAC9PTV9_9PSEU|nr:MULTISPECIES: ABC transporter ATP-binding protein [Actinoalloteichus]APU16462.1 ABC-type cobalamin/Fe3+-siderophore transport system, ATPase component [Actinoalloteichus fjordicus]APU22521.1 ABC-type cobalamin/Fe3+-siderophore transport system, ATPase component [Actinoalloteichus sp. GBA129-24]